MKHKYTLVCALVVVTGVWLLVQHVALGPGSGEAQTSTEVVVSLSINGQTSKVVETSGLVQLALNVVPGTDTDVVAWFFIIKIKGIMFFATPDGGCGTTMEPLHIGPPVLLRDLLLVNTELEPGEYEFTLVLVREDRVAGATITANVGPSEPECTDPREVEANLNAAVPDQFCIPEIITQVGPFAVDVCVGHPGASCNPDFGCDLNIDNSNVVLDLLTEDVAIHLQGSANGLPVDIGGEVSCLANVTFDIRARVGILHAPAGPGAVEVTGLGVPVFDNVQINITAEGDDFLCGLLADLGTDLIGDQLEGLVGAEVVNQLGPAIIGEVICHQVPQ